MSRSMVPRLTSKFMVSSYVISAPCHHPVRDLGVMIYGVDTCYLDAISYGTEKRVVEIMTLGGINVDFLKKKWAK